MSKTILPGTIHGEITAVSSKSHLHRLLICAALSEGETIIRHGALCEDIDATCRCLSALGAQIERCNGEIRVIGIGSARTAKAEFDCGESGSTYRFLLPIACALGIDATFLLAGRLPQRPIGELVEQMQAHGASVSGIGTNCVRASGILGAGAFTIPGNISSQYITGLLFAMPLTGKSCTLTVTGNLESAAYVDLTLSCLHSFGINVLRDGNAFHVSAGQKYRSPGIIQAEGDWSNAAFALCAAAAGQGEARVLGLSMDSVQGDKAVLEIIRRFGADAGMQGNAAYVKGAKLSACHVDIGPIPDMAPAISLMGAMASGETVLEHVGRLRLKESDRVASILSLLRSIGANSWADEDSIHILGTGGERLPGGTVNSFSDHRIAMAASCAAAICAGPVTILEPESVAKSYPTFYEDLPRLGLMEGGVQ